MSTHFHAVVWTVHNEERTFHFNVSEIDQIVLHPQNGKRLIRHLNTPHLSAEIAGVETVDHPTDSELVAHARTYFGSDHQKPARDRCDH